MTTTAMPSPHLPGAPDAKDVLRTPNKPHGPPHADMERRNLIQATAAAGGVAALVMAVPFVSSLAPSERARSLGAAIEVDIADLAPGETRTVEWRGKPVWIVRRTPQMLQALEGHDTELADPRSAKDQQPAYARNAQRSIQPDVFVAVGICTHLGCSPTQVPLGSAQPGLGEGWPGGFFCPCHGSTFDNAGRVYRNKPAPTNLEVPPHQFITATQLRIGDDNSA